MSSRLTRRSLAPACMLSLLTAAILIAGTAPTALAATTAQPLDLHV